MKNILFFTDNFPPEHNAAASRVYERACHWIKWGHEVTIITCAPNFPEGKLFAGYKNKFYQVEYIDGIRVVRVKTFIAANKGFFLRILDNISFTLPAFIAGLFQKRPDVVVATTPSLFAAISALMVSKLRRIPFVLEVSDLWPASIVGVGAMRDSFVIRALEKVELFLYRSAKKVIVLSPAFQDNLISRGIDSKKMSVVINGVDLSRYAPRLRDENFAANYKISQNHFVIGYIGTHGMAHALENVIHTAALLQHHPHIHFMFVGAGADRDKLIKLSQEKSLTNISFIPAQAKDRIADFWSLCNVALVHLRNAVAFSEVIPSKIFEAMGMGLPIVIAAPSGVATTLVEQEKMGFTVPPENPEALAKILQYCYDNPAILDNMKNINYQNAPRFSREQQAEAFLEAMKLSLTP